MTNISTNPLEGSTTYGRITGKEIVTNLGNALSFFLSSSTLKNIKRFDLEDEYESMTDFVNHITINNSDATPIEELIRKHTCNLTHVPMKYMMLESNLDKLWFILELAVKMLIAHNDVLKTEGVYTGFNYGGLMEQEIYASAKNISSGRNAYETANSSLMMFHEVSSIFDHGLRVNVLNKLGNQYFYTKRVGSLTDMCGSLKEVLDLNVSHDVVADKALLVATELSNHTNIEHLASKLPTSFKNIDATALCVSFDDYGDYLCQTKAYSNAMANYTRGLNELRVGRSTMHVCALPLALAILDKQIPSTRIEKIIKEQIDRCNLRDILNTEVESTTELDPDGFVSFRTSVFFVLSTVAKHSNLIKAEDSKQFTILLTAYNEFKELFSLTDKSN